MAKREKKTHLEPSRAATPAGVARTVEELREAGWTKRKAGDALKRYVKWGDNEITWKIQAESRNGWISRSECELFLASADVQRMEDAPSSSLTSDLAWIENWGAW